MNKKTSHFQLSFCVALALAAIFILAPQVSLAITPVSPANTDASIAREQEQMQFLISKLKKDKNALNFGKDVYFGMKGENVKNLQTFLTENKFYQGPATGYYGTQTMNAVKKFQRANNINPTGYFGTKSRSAANKVLEDFLKKICGSGGC